MTSSEPHAPSPGGLPGDVAEDLHDGGGQGLFFLEMICYYLS